MEATVWDILTGEALFALPNFGYFEFWNWTNAFGRTFRGADSLETFLRENLFPNYPVATSEIEMQNFQPLSRRYIGSDAAVIHAYTSSQRGSALSGNERRIYFDFVLARTNEGWKIAHQTISDIREIRN